jgi:hypothetical protein
MMLVSYDEIAKNMSLPSHPSTGIALIDISDEQQRLRGNDTL